MLPHGGRCRRDSVRNERFDGSVASNQARDLEINVVAVRYDAGAVGQSQGVEGNACDTVPFSRPPYEQLAAVER